MEFQLDNVDGGRPFEIDPGNWTDLQRHIVGNFLGYLSRESYLAAGFLASALVVDRRDQRPSRIFSSG